MQDLPRAFLMLLELPYHAVMLLSSQKNFARNPLIGSRLLNRLGLHIGRKRLAAAMTSIRRARLRKSLDDELVERFDRQGYIRINDFLCAEDFASIKKELLSNTWIFLEMRQPSTATLRINLDASLCRDRYPAIQKLLVNPALRSWLSYAAGYPGEPIIAIQVIRSGGVASGHDPQSDWHADTFHSTSKAWLFLHDVAENEGPFAYIPGSHRLTNKRLLWEKEQSLEAADNLNVYHRHGSFRASEIELEQMGYSITETMAVAGNTLVVGDTSGFHRRTPSPGPTTRLEVYASLRRNPFFAGFFPHVMALPWVRDHWAELALSYFQRKSVSKKGSAWVPSKPRKLNTDEVDKLMSMKGDKQQGQAKAGILEYQGRVH